MTTTIKIVLDNYDDSCYAGQTLAGRVECFFPEGRTILGVRIKFKGKAQTKWVESERYYDNFSKKRRTRNVRYSGEEVYFNQEHILIGGGTKFRLPPGKYSYLFSYILPEELPSSFQGSDGNIEYTIKATINCPWHFDDETKVVLKLISLSDLNCIPHVREPASRSVDTALSSCWCISSDTLTFDVSLPFTGYVPGQHINIGSYIQNTTSINTDVVKFKIIKNVEFIATSPKKSSKFQQYEIASCMDSGVGAHAEKSWTSFLSVSGDDYVNLLPCSIINATYTLKAKVVIPFPHTNLRVDIPLTIGDIPLTGISTTLPRPLSRTDVDVTTSSADNVPLLPATEVSYPIRSSGNENFTAFTILSAQLPAEISYTPQAAPSCEEAQQIKQKKEHEN